MSSLTNAKIRELKARGQLLKPALKVGHDGLSPQFISALDEIGYQGGVAVEHEDPVYSGDRFDEGLVRGWQVLSPLVK